MPSVLETLRHNLAADPEALAGAGGNTVNLIAGAALKIGDVVYVSAAKTVNKSVTVGDGAKFAGVVVGGGGSFGHNYAMFGTSEVGLALVPSGRAAEVQVDGIANVVSGAAIAVGDLVGFDTGTAG